MFFSDWAGRTTNKKYFTEIMKATQMMLFLLRRFFVPARGLFMVLRSRNGHADASTQSWAFMVLRGVLRLRRLNGRLQFLGGTRQTLTVDARRVRKDERGP